MRDDLILMITELVSTLPIGYSIDEKQKVYDAWRKKYAKELEFLSAVLKLKSLEK